MKTFIVLTTFSVLIVACIAATIEQSDKEPLIESKEPLLPLTKGKEPLVDSKEPLLALAKEKEPLVKAKDRNGRWWGGYGGWGGYGLGGWGGYGGYGYGYPYYSYWG